MRKITTFILLLCALCMSAQSKQDLYQNFNYPPESARIRVWWHWMNGNITKDGIRKDLFWMKRAGIGGFQNFDGGLATPQLVDKRLAYMTPEWQDAFSYTAQLADSLGLEFAIASAPGWSETGGPWVAPKDGMKKLTWRSMTVDGGKKGIKFNGKLPEPYKTVGNFQNVPIKQDESGAQIGLFSDNSNSVEEYYEDIAVLAFKVSEDEADLLTLKPKVTSSGGSFTLEQLVNDDLNDAAALPRNANDDYAWIQFEFAEPFTLRAVSMTDDNLQDTYNQSTGGEGNKILEASDDGISFRKVATLSQGKAIRHTASVPTTTARFFRMKYLNPSSMTPSATGSVNVTPLPESHVAELNLYSTPRVNYSEEKTGFAADGSLFRFPTLADGSTLAKDDVMDITSFVSDGVLTYDLPAGKWQIIRIGFSLTGKQNHPASPEATGLEVDKMDRNAVRNYYEHYIDMYMRAAGGRLGTTGITYMLNDSYEAGTQTWTPQMAQEFQKRRGYALIPWMPALLGYVVNSAEETDRFLWDWRKTISELIAENHYDQLTDILRERGMKGRYTESHEQRRVYVVDGMDVKRTAQIPMSAFWVTMGAYNPDIRESASVAHIYGQNIAAAESFTSVGIGSAWNYYPGNLKIAADHELANGLNRFVIHTSPHQPVDDKQPGVSLSVFGQWFDRHDTWAEYARPWTDYLARSSYMLQQGKFVADIAYYYGEDNNITSLFANEGPAVPDGYAYDFVNANALMHQMSGQNGLLVTYSGMRYRMLYLDANASNMSLTVLRKIADLAKAGVVICGAKPTSMSSLSDNQEEFDRLVKEVWESGKSNVFAGLSVQQALNMLNIQPDFISPDYDIRYVHRQLPNGEIYWVNNMSDENRSCTVSFRTTGRKPQLWHPVTGKVEEVSYQIADGRTQVYLRLVPNDAVFIVFLEDAQQEAVTQPVQHESTFASFTTPWVLTFESKFGKSPATATMRQLFSLSEAQDNDIKYFSGTTTYANTLTLTKKQLRDTGKLKLKLGDVKNLAEVIVNGKSMGVVWKTPFEVDVTDVLVVGANVIQIKVVNTWVNRLIGDSQPEVTEKTTYTTFPYYNALSPLQPAGLLGPVEIVSVR